MGHNLIIPDAVQFKCDLDEGAAQLSTYDNKFEISIDFRAFQRENVRISMAEMGVISVSVVSPQKGAPDLYHERMIVPKHEMARWGSFVCKMNKDGILRISSVPHPHPHHTYQSAPGSSTTTATQHAEQSSDSGTKAIAQIGAEIPEDKKPVPAFTKSKIQKGRVKTGPGATTSTSQLADPSQSVQNIFIVKPQDSDFVCDVSLIQSRPDFRVTADKTWRTFVNCTRYKPEDIKIEVIGHSIVRVSKKEEEVGSLRPFLHEIPIPSGCKAEDIEVTFNERGVLRLVAETEESRSEAKKLVVLPPAPILIPIKAKVQPKGKESIRTKTAVSTPWGQRVATATSAVTPEPITASGDGQFRTSIIAQDYKADELEIEIKDGWLTIIGRKQKTSPFGASNTFTKKIQIPENVNPESITCGQDAATGMIHISTEASPPQ